MVAAQPKVDRTNPTPWYKRLFKRKKKSRKQKKRDAESFYKDFHWGEEPSRIKRARLSPTPDAVTELGDLVAVTYRTNKGGERATWEHEFGEEGGKKPKLVADPETTRLHIVGGDYTITGAGIID